MPWVVGSGVLAAVGIGAGIAFTVAANSKSEEAASIDMRLGDDSSCYGKPLEGDCKALRDTVDTQSNFANIAAGAMVLGSVAAVGAVVTYVFWPRAKDEQKGSGARVTPWVGPYGAGLAGTF
jgi:hypothetical protein